MDAGENVAKVSRLRVKLGVVGGSGGCDVRCGGVVGRRGMIAMRISAREASMLCRWNSDVHGAM
jgi:hypothetical protein